MHQKGIGKYSMYHQIYCNVFLPASFETALQTQYLSSLCNHRIRCSIPSQTPYFLSLPRLSFVSASVLTKAGEAGLCLEAVSDVGPKNEFPAEKVKDIFMLLY